MGVGASCVPGWAQQGRDPTSQDKMEREHPKSKERGEHRSLRAHRCWGLGVRVVKPLLPGPLGTVLELLVQLPGGGWWKGHPKTPQSPGFWLNRECLLAVAVSRLGGSSPSFPGGGGGDLRQGASLHPGVPPRALTPTLTFDPSAPCPFKTPHYAGRGGAVPTAPPQRGGSPPAGALAAHWRAVGAERVGGVSPPSHLPPRACARVVRSALRAGRAGAAGRQRRTGPGGGCEPGPPLPRAGAWGVGDRGRAASGEVGALGRSPAAEGSAFSCG